MNSARGQPRGGVLRRLGEDVHRCQAVVADDFADRDARSGVRRHEHDVHGGFGPDARDWHAPGDRLWPQAHILISFIAEIIFFGLARARLVGFCVVFLAGARSPHRAHRAPVESHPVNAGACRSPPAIRRTLAVSSPDSLRASRWWRNAANGSASVPFQHPSRLPARKRSG